MKILIVIDDLELKYFEFNDLVTDFWFNKEYLERGYEVSICIKGGLFIKENKGFTLCYNTYEKNGDIFHEEMPSEELIETFDIVYFRPDPPVDTDYINACFVFDFVDKKKTKIVNNTQKKGVNNIYLEKKE